MAHIKLNNVSLDYPIYNAQSRSLKKHIAIVATGGKINSDTQGRVVIRSLSEINITIDNGERVGLIGHNGSGKSSLLRLLSGVYSPTHGSIETEGNIGSLLDISLGIDPEATGRENIYIRGALLGMEKKFIQQKCEEVIAFSELGEFADMPLRTYSSGMHLRLAFSISTIIRPQILLMDEWLSVGDEGFKNKAKLRMTEVVESSSILVIASHSAELLRSICSRVIWLEHGSIKLDGPPADILPHYFSA